MLSYKDILQDTITELSFDDKFVVVGYNIKHNNTGLGMFGNVEKDKLIETMLAEGLMTGMAIGMAIEGFKPLLYFERFDFITNAIDMIVNHLDKIKDLSKGDYNPNIVIRCVVGGTEKPFFTGPTHTQDFSDVMDKFVHFPVIRLTHKAMIKSAYKEAFDDIDKHSTLIVEYKDLYDE